ncbi:uncharacterized protein OCT59_012283 [Rhizophagus irregularis]|uniref:Type I restriction enzyme R protein N-terminal domain-containing protein n=2 Tax=Rhizophagus irregularis TaxID=588596 RepID=A0A015KY84_RHIIW|nr:hypothetical protein GLOIN_2v1470520 [Rhizophagus irregularis DAOM 181602=DAOM 197198]EXX64991.1 hypothetical protein RirG_137580 [Rhizophagus irregularis DAOM 197198w]POG81683.1 hypothetical protein GLOIN_2v1470520 [Rhizophagus irregularis DAOM 181602=DAOM 197198]UZO01179.1 hypothetical protein OCT59_012283 [Rhizophagus irregularis]GBC40187.1 hypothetical protein GLOIN_2v1470520 [Rhizophagus irregularis DAOM 181602=DAOM 197198]|eukprot:XP_025188549.1 hypothetical protein GLOIN_2v1470520 [Rhizophagus irregularis DAOM 181602=DAOM 197198]
MNFSDYKKTIDVIVESLLMVQKTSPNVATANEASRREYISPILHGVAYFFQNSIKIYPEHELVGSYGHGPVDWTIMVNNKYILITEAKKVDVDHGVGQNIIQLQSAFQKNRKNNHDSPSVLYGIDNNDRPIEVFKSSLTPIILPLSEPGLNKATLTPRVEELFGQLLWIFNEQLNSRGTLKRSHT